MCWEPRLPLLNLPARLTVEARAGCLPSKTQRSSQTSFRKTQRGQGCRQDSPEATGQPYPLHVETPPGYDMRNY